MRCKYNVVFVNNTRCQFDEIIVLLLLLLLSNGNAENIEKNKTEKYVKFVVPSFAFSVISTFYLLLQAPATIILHAWVTRLMQWTKRPLRNGGVCCRCVNSWWHFVLNFGIEFFLRIFLPSLANHQEPGNGMYGAGGGEGGWGCEQRTVIYDTNFMFMWHSAQNTNRFEKIFVEFHSQRPAPHTFQVVLYFLCFSVFFLLSAATRNTVSLLFSEANDDTEKTWSHEFLARSSVSFNPWTTSLYSMHDSVRCSRSGSPLERHTSVDERETVFRWSEDTNRYHSSSQCVCVCLCVGTAFPFFRSRIAILVAATKKWNEMISSPYLPSDRLSPSYLLTSMTTKMCLIIAGDEEWWNFIPLCRLSVDSRLSFVDVVEVALNHVITSFL